MAEKKVVIYSPLNNKIHPETEAEVVLITDLNNNYTSSNVEGALQEVGASLLNKANSSHNHIIGDVNGLQLSLDAKAPLASPSLTGTPTAPTAAVNTNTTQVATTAFVNAEIANDAAPKIHTHTTSDVTNLGTILGNYQLRSEKGQSNGYASLGADGLVPTTQLPSYVDDVLEFANLASFPAIGESGKIYIALDTNKTYRWSGSVYVYITSGAVDSVAGKTGVVSLVKGDVGLSNVDNTADIVKSVASAATLTTARTLTIGSTGKTFDGSANVSWTLAEIGAQAAGSYAPLSHSHGNITNAGAIGTTAGLMIKTTTSGLLTTLAAGTTAQYLRGDGSWATPPDNNTTYTAGNGISLSSTTFSVAGGNGLVQETSGLALGTPTTLTAATANALTTTSHTHAITTTTSGAVSTIVATDASGNITAADTLNLGTAADIKYNATTKSIDFIFT